MSYLSQALKFCPMAGGAICGLGAAFAPSPHSVFLVYHALKGASSSWIKAFLMGAFCFELSLVLLIWAVGQNLSRASLLTMGWIGTGYLTKSAVDLFFSKPTLSSPGPEGEWSLGSAFKNGFAIQLLNPNPYIFWTTIGLSQVQSDPLFGVLFFSFLNATKYGWATMLSRFHWNFPVKVLSQVSAVLLLLASFLIHLPR
jgi:threonine/homoserine/homoserine lactone efflux protein